MNSPEASSQKASLSDYLAAERTLLAWIRTGLALMGFGFVVARFGLFLRQIQLVNHETPAQNFAPSLWFGTALIAVGVLVNILAGYRHVHLVRGLEHGDHTEFHRRTPAVAVAYFLAIVGLAMTIYLVTIRE
jgi:putative membrane protein